MGEIRIQGRGWPMMTILLSGSYLSPYIKIKINILLIHHNTNKTFNGKYKVLINPNCQNAKADESTRIINLMRLNLIRNCSKLVSTLMVAFFK